MRVFRIVMTAWLVVGLSAPAIAGDLREAVEQAGRLPAEEPDTRSIPKPYLWIGTGMFIGGMAIGLYGFMHNKNGDFPGDDEFNATDRKLGATGLLTAFGGGMVLLLGKHKAAPSVTVSRDRLVVAKSVSWK